MGLSMYLDLGLEPYVYVRSSFAYGVQVAAIMISSYMLLRLPDPKP